MMTSGERLDVLLARMQALAPHADLGREVTRSPVKGEAEFRAAYEKAKTEAIEAAGAYADS